MFASLPTRDRVIAALAAALVEGLVGYALITSLNIRPPVHLDDVLKVLDLESPPPPPAHEKPLPRPAKSHKREGAASPPNLRAKPTEIVAPRTVLPVVPPLAAAPKAGTGHEASAGAAPVRGPGFGSGGQGNGTGSGGSGDGEGDGGETPLRLLSGHIKLSDYSRAIRDSEFGGTVHFHFGVGTNGRVTDCVITQSSGSAEFDDTVCRVIRQRFRYAPTRNAHGEAIPDVVTGTQSLSKLRGQEEPDGEAPDQR